MRKDIFVKFIDKSWRKPELRAPFGHRQASWIELFFDLIFVSAFGVLNIVNFEEDIYISHEEFFLYVLGFISLWIVWMNITYYSNHFENRTLRHRSILFLNLITVGMLTYGINDNVSGIINKQSIVYMISFILSRLILIISWKNAYSDKIPEQLRTMIGRLGVLYGLSAVSGIIIFIMLVWLDYPIKYGISIWAVTLAIEIIAVSVIIAVSQKNLTTIHREHIVERFGLLTMLLLGEMIVNTLGGFRANADINPELIARGILVLLLIFMYWSIYYDQVMVGAYQEDSRSRIIWTSFQFMFALTTMIFSAYIGQLASGAELEPVAKNTIIMALIIYFVTILILSITIDVSDRLESEQLGAEEFVIPVEYKVLGTFRLLTVGVLGALYFIDVKSTMNMILIFIAILGMNIILGEYAERSIFRYGSKRK
ncbi:MAG: low temperature requirement protein A [Proteocatella sp.]